MNSTPERWHQIARLYELTAECDPSARDAFLNDATLPCGRRSSRCSARMRHPSSWIGRCGPQPRPYFPMVRTLVAGRHLVPIARRELPRPRRHGSGLPCDGYRLDRPVAVKVLPTGVALDPQRRMRFAREPKAVAALTHPHICTLYDLDNLQRAVRLDDSLTIRALQAHVFAVAGRNAEAAAVIREVQEAAKHRYFCPYEIATVYASLGDNETAYKLFRKGTHERADCMPWLGVEPWLNRFRLDPRYRTLLRDIGPRSRNSVVVSASFLRLPS